MEDFSKVKLEKSPYIKNLFYNDRKTGAFFMILAETNTVVDKGIRSSLYRIHQNCWEKYENGGFLESQCHLESSERNS